jgi:uncharacterized protein YjgD (DUF1641 family)
MEIHDYYLAMAKNDNFIIKTLEEIKKMIESSEELPHKELITIFLSLVFVSTREMILESKRMRRQTNWMMILTSIMIFLTALLVFLTFLLARPLLGS